MPGFASLEIEEPPLSRPCVTLGVFRYDPSALERYVLLPNIRVISIAYREGPDPGLARFQYVFDPVDPSTDPRSFEEVLSTESTLRNVVQNDERIVVLVEGEDGSVTPVFDGFAQVPEVSLSPSQELVSFVAYGVAVREWDSPISGSLMRDADDLEDGSKVATDLKLEFNRDGKPNATPLGADASHERGIPFPLFADGLVIREPDQRRLWTLPMAVRYLCFHHNATEQYVRNPDSAGLDALLDARFPRAGVTMDPADPSSYESQPIVVGEYSPYGKPWPIALNDLLAAHGFGMAFKLEVDGHGDPFTRLEIYRKHDAAPGTYKWLSLQAAGESLAPSRSNVAVARLARDTTRVANSFRVEGALELFEASFILAPGFSISGNDAATPEALKAFERNATGFARQNKDRYRLFVLDETGEGHWDFSGGQFVHTAVSLDGLLGSDLDERSWVKRRRVPRNELLSLDANRKPLKARLSVSTDYQGLSPGLWDGSGTWQPISGGFDLLNDRLGIWVNVLSPNGWAIGLPVSPGLPFPSGVIRVVESLAGSPPRKFFLRLTCVIEGDRVVKGLAERRPSSSSRFTIQRHVDASHRYQKHVITESSEFNGTGEAIVSHDDSEVAENEALAQRLSNETGEVAGEIVIPRFTSAYQIGDKICAIVGRGLSLRTNAGAPIEEAPVFPSVVGIAWDLERGQRTVLQLSDHRGETR